MSWFRTHALALPFVAACCSSPTPQERAQLTLRDIQFSIGFRDYINIAARWSAETGGDFVPSSTPLHSQQVVVALEGQRRWKDLEEDVFEFEMESVGWNDDHVAELHCLEELPAGWEFVSFSFKILESRGRNPQDTVVTLDKAMDKRCVRASTFGRAFSENGRQKVQLVRKRERFLSERIQSPPIFVLMGQEISRYPIQKPLSVQGADEQYVEWTALVVIDGSSRYSTPLLTPRLSSL